MSKVSARSKRSKQGARKASTSAATAVDRRLLEQAAREDDERTNPSSTLRSIKAAPEAKAPRYTADLVRRELQEVAKSLTKLNDNIIEACTNSDSSFAGEAFSDALRQVLGLRVFLEDMADGMVAGSGEAEVES